MGKEELIRIGGAIKNSIRDLAWIVLSVLGGAVLVASIIDIVSVVSERAAMILLMPGAIAAQILHGFLGIYAASSDLILMDPFAIAGNVLFYGALMGTLAWRIHIRLK